MSFEIGSEHRPANPGQPRGLRIHLAVLRQTSGNRIREKLTGVGDCRTLSRFSGIDDVL